MTSIDEKTRESRLRWFGHVQRRVTNVLIKKSKLIQVEGTKNGGVSQKITLVELVKNDMSINEVIETMISDRIEWRKRMHVTDLD